LLDYGFRAIIAPSFADIFANNCMKNGIVPVSLPEEEVYELARRAREEKDYRVTVDLERGFVRDGAGFETAFLIDEFSRYCLLEGLDDIGLTLRHDAEITAYEKSRPRWRQTFGAEGGSQVAL
nr:3-isopropylmalate dehydratase small subunit [Acidobacteriota bacterium]